MIEAGPAPMQVGAVLVLGPSERLTPVAEKLGLLAPRQRDEGGEGGPCGAGRAGGGSIDLGRARRELFSERERVGEELNRLIDSIKVDAAPLDKLITHAGHRSSRHRGA